MFRISQYMQELKAPLADPRVRKPAGPVVIWNLIRRCNLTCKHCYSISADIDFPGELDTREVFGVMEDLRSFAVPVLILSGGEPLLRPDIFDISRRAKAMGFYVGLSTNGTLIDENNIDQIAAVGYDYVGIKIGMRFSPTQDNARELPRLLDVMGEERVDKLYVSHLNYGGRGNRNRRSDVVLQTSRWVMDLLFDACWADIKAGRRREYVTGNNDADGVYLLRWTRRHVPEHYVYLRERLAQWGGNSSGENIANIDNTGNVHPDTFWWNYNLGNVKERPFSQIWMDTRDPLMAGLKASPRPLKGRCRVCHYQDVCGGNTRVRAFQLTGDPWWEDPACYLDDQELGISEADYAGDEPESMGLEIRSVRHAG